MKRLMLSLMIPFSSYRLTAILQVLIVQTNNLSDKIDFLIARLHDRVEKVKNEVIALEATGDTV